MLEYEFETVQCDYGAGYSLFGGVGLETDGHREIILRRGPEGWTLSVTIRQGLNRQIRRMCALAELRVERLERIREGRLELGDLAEGCWRPLTDRELSSIL